MNDVSSQNIGKYLPSAELSYVILLTNFQIFLLSLVMRIGNTLPNFATCLLGQYVNCAKRKEIRIASVICKRAIKRDRSFRSEISV